MDSQRPEPSTTFQVFSSTATSLHLKWHITSDLAPFIQALRVHYHKMDSTYIQYSSMLTSSAEEYWINSLVADTYYNICLVQYRNDTKPINECVEASTTKWHIPVSIGSSIGAVLALSMIVLIVLLSRCSAVLKLRRKKSKGKKKYNSMSHHYPTEDHYEYSDTMTNGHDDLGSEHDVSYVFEIPHSHTDSRHSSMTTDKVYLTDGRNSQMFSQYHNPHIKYIGGKHSMDSHLMANEVENLQRQLQPHQCSNPHHIHGIQEAYLIPPDAYLIRDNQIILLPIDETGQHRHSSLPSFLYGFQESEETEVQGAEGGADPPYLETFLSAKRYDSKEYQQILEPIPCFPEEEEAFCLDHIDCDQHRFQKTLHPITESPVQGHCSSQIATYELQDVKKRTGNDDNSLLIPPNVVLDEHSV